MGAAKQWDLEQWERGYRWVADKYVCAQCVDDPALRTRIEEHAESTVCSYCGRESGHPIASELDQFLGWIAEAIAEDWDDAQNFMPYEGDGWALPEANRHIYELLADGELEVDVHPDLFDDIMEAFGDRTFAPRYYFGLGPDERLHFGWDAFVEQVTHEKRYLFVHPTAAGDHQASPGELSPSEMLSEIGRIVATGGLVHELEAGTALHRGRLHERARQERRARGSELGTPPAEHARLSNRMSPNGIPMFYGAFDNETAVAETTAAGWGEDVDLTVGEFVNRQQLRVVDLPDMPAIPSLHDPAHRSDRPWVGFLHRFAEEVRKPIDREEREHLEYVPTQIVTEYFRHVFGTEHDLALDGIVYPSAVREGGRCIVLFVENDACGDAGNEGPAVLVLARAFSFVRPTS